WYTSEIDYDPVTQETRRLYGSTGEAAVLTATPSPTIQYGDTTYRLEPAEYTQYKITVGQTKYSMLKELYGSDMYKSLSDADRAGVVKKVYEYAGALGKKEYFSKKDADYDLESWMKEMQSVERQGASAADYILIRDKVNDIKSDATQTAQQKKAAYVDSLKTKHKDLWYETFVLSDDAASREKYKTVKGYGLSAKVYYEFQQVQSDKYPNGTIIDGSKRAKQIKIILDSDVPG
ncbi:MAG TPA: hypothetical protein DEA44_16910, partial [Firmicutes bacterium]|nr:hypothetical protein [Bacillota bacterium]